MRKYSIRSRPTLHEVFQSLEIQKQKQHSDNSFRDLISRIENRIIINEPENNDLTWKNIRRELFKRDKSINKIAPRLLNLATRALNLNFKKTKGACKKEDYIDFLKSENVSLDKVVDTIITQRNIRLTDISKRDLITRSQYSGDSSP